MQYYTNSPSTAAASNAYIVALTQIGAMKIAVTAIAQPGTPRGRRIEQTAKSDAVYAIYPAMMALGCFAIAARPSTRARIDCTTGRSE